MTSFNGYDPWDMMRLWTGYDTAMNGYEKKKKPLMVDPITVMTWRLLPCKTLKESSEETIRWSAGYDGYEPSGGYSAFGGYERLWCGYDRIWNPGYELVMMRLWTDMKPLVVVTDDQHSERQRQWREHVHSARKEKKEEIYQEVSSGNVVNKIPKWGEQIFKNNMLC